jgi:hypothetical protein
MRCSHNAILKLDDEQVEEPDHEGKESVVHPVPSRTCVVSNIVCVSGFGGPIDSCNCLLRSCMSGVNRHTDNEASNLSMAHTIYTYIHSKLNRAKKEKKCFLFADRQSKYKGVVT